MCIIFAYNGSQDEDSEYSLIIASNRDELYERPSRNMWYWEEDSNIIGGRDLQPGASEGTWLAMSLSRQKLGVLLNLPRTPKPNATSRGKIVADFVKSEQTSTDYIESLESYAKECNDFVFIAFEFRNLKPTVTTYSNDSDITTKHEETCLGFGNSLPDTPLKKVEVGKNQMKEICQKLNKVQMKDELVGKLIELLKSDERHLPDPELEKRRPTIQNQLSSIFVKIPEANYGTRTHTLILITKTGHVDVIEISLQPPINLINPQWKKTEFQFDI